ncbi:MAG: RluA family pseudouridine synthase [Pseudomonadota bacterium]|jgi:23S rRNA pseudouridine1911/1915/1917 synthase|nr:RluA family pseudouridine synthase [Alphaproteobacteria bacterium]
MDEEHYDVTAEEHHQGIRLDKFLSLTTPLSRTRIQDLLEKNAITVNPLKPFDASSKVKRGECYTIKVPTAIEAEPSAQNIPLNIVFEDEHLLVINKPADFVVHPAPGHADGTLVNALLHHCGASLSGIGGVKRPGIVHRLDKDTSGLLVIAKNDKAHHKLSQQFHDREDHLEKLYWAIVWGAPYPASGTIDAPIGRHPKDRQKMGIVKNGKNAQTSYKVLKTFCSLKDAQYKISLIECKLHTGRTHQIRVHLHHLGTPIIGDNVYGKKPKSGVWPEDAYDFPRQALHAYSLTFLHPISQTKLSFQAPLAEDMENLLNALT